MNRFIPCILALILLVSSCAKVVTPVGGPKDTTPPKILKEQPANKNVSFNTKQIKITFDEFFTLNNPSENVLISPPIDHEPEYSIKNKSLIIRFQDTLKPNTTYNMLFSNCIQDYHEGNKLSAYHYSFSTGSALDSFQLKGTLVSAKTLKPTTDFFVLLYKKDLDSLPLTTLPDYVTKSLSDGSFHFSNIAAGKYRIFAIKDINGNLIYDLPNEEIGFCDSLLTAIPEPQLRSKDSTHVDSLNGKGGKGRGQQTALKIDSNALVIYTFIAGDTMPHLQRYENPEEGLYKFPYKNPFDNFEATALFNPIDHFQVINTTQDTVTWYMKEIPTDTMKYLLTADGHTDTVLLKTYKPKVSSGRGSRANATKRLNVSYKNAGHFFLPLTLSFSYPIRPVDSFPVYAYSQHDTLVKWHSVPDTFTKELALDLSFETKKSYTILIPDSIFYGYNNLTHDTLRTKFVMKSEKDYGNLIMNYQLPDDNLQYIAQLWYGDKLYQQDYLNKNKSITYPHLDPGSYKVYMIQDRNRNGRWDSGNYFRKCQPERTIIFQSPINIRAFWDDEETFIVK